MKESSQSNNLYVFLVVFKTEVSVQAQGTVLYTVRQKQRKHSVRVKRHN